MLACVSGSVLMQDHRACFGGQPRPGPSTPSPGLAAAWSPFFRQVFSPVIPPRQVTGRGAIAQGGENPTFVSGKQRFINKQAEANWKGKLAML